jgi:hypothetical protein
MYRCIKSVNRNGATGNFLSKNGRKYAHIHMHTCTHIFQRFSLRIPLLCSVHIIFYCRHTSPKRPSYYPYVIELLAQMSCKKFLHKQHELGSEECIISLVLIKCSSYRKKYSLTGKLVTNGNTATRN